MGSFLVELQKWLTKGKPKRCCYWENSKGYKIEGPLGKILKNYMDVQMRFSLLYNYLCCTVPGLFKDRTQKRCAETQKVLCWNQSGRISDTVEFQWVLPEDAVEFQ